MSINWKKWTRNDILFGFLLPLIVALVIIAFPASSSVLASINPALIGILVYGFEEVIMLAAIPLFLGLLWNQWAGGVSGFMLGSLYAIQYALLGTGTPGWSSDISLLGYVVSAMLIGYMAGALNKKSDNFYRMVIAGLIATITGALVLFLTYQLSSYALVTGPFGLFLTVVPRITAAVLCPVFAKIFIRFDLKPKQTS
jgi:hypothetical protein